MTDEQLAIDIKRMECRRHYARKQLSELKEWGYFKNGSVFGGTLFLGLWRDIRKSTEGELERIIGHLEEHNQANLMKKLTTF